MKHTHSHHIIPKHAGGTDDPSNLVELTLEEHIAAHKKRYDELGEDYDRIAYQMMSGKIGKEAGIKQVQQEAGRQSKGRKWSPEQKARHSKKILTLWPDSRKETMSEKRSGEGHHYFGKERSEETKAKISAAITGTKKGPPTDETKAKISKALTGKTRQPLTDEQKRKISEAQKARLAIYNPQKGKKRGPYGPRKKREVV